MPYYRGNFRTLRISGLPTRLIGRARYSRYANCIDMAYQLYQCSTLDEGSPNESENLTVMLDKSKYLKRTA